MSEQFKIHNKESGFNFNCMTQWLHLAPLMSGNKPLTKLVQPSLYLYMKLMVMLHMSTHLLLNCWALIKILQILLMAALWKIVMVNLQVKFKKMPYFYLFKKCLSQLGNHMLKVLKSLSVMLHQKVAQLYMIVELVL